MKSDNLQIAKAILNAKGSLAVEGLYLTNEEEALIKERLTRKITEEEFRKKAKKIINNHS